MPPQLSDPESMCSPLSSCPQRYTQKSLTLSLVSILFPAYSPRQVLNLLFNLSYAFSTHTKPLVPDLHSSSPSSCPQTFSQKSIPLQSFSSFSTQLQPLVYDLLPNLPLCLLSHLQVLVPDCLSILPPPCLNSISHQVPEMLSNHPPCFFTTPTTDPATPQAPLSPHRSSNWSPTLPLIPLSLRVHSFI